jgi:hypothetical protein
MQSEGRVRLEEKIVNLLLNIHVLGYGIRHPKGHMGPQFRRWVRATEID